MWACVGAVDGVLSLCVHPQCQRRATGGMGTTTPLHSRHNSLGPIEDQKKGRSFPVLIILIKRGVALVSGFDDYYQMG